MGKGVVDLVFDLVMGVSEEDGRVLVTGTHLCAGALQRREELRVEQSRLLPS
jgi:hypothetical protein